MEDRTMEISFPEEKRLRVIVNTDAKNEADDQYAIVHAILTPAFDLHGIIPAHFGEAKTPTSLKDSHDEVMLLLDLMGMRDDIRVEDGATHAIPDECTPVDSPGARFIIEEAMKDDPRPLHVAFYGPLTDMASALLLEPEIEKRDVRVVWIGGGVWPLGGQEYNLSNDISAANVVMRSSVEVWQIPKPVYRWMPVSYAELAEKVYPCGEIGRYLVEQLVDHNVRRLPTATEYRSLGDSPAVGIIIYPDCGKWQWRPAPEFEPTMHYRHTGRNRPIRFYEDIDSRFILEDFFAKLQRFARSKQA
jgi:inosine-uridine nucleoside N-ribohydrolase